MKTTTTKTVMAAIVAVATVVVMATETEVSTPLDTTGGATLDVATGDTLIYTGKITGSGTLTKNGGGTLALANGENDFSGGVKINAGYVRADAAGCFGTGSVYAYNDGVAGGLVFAASNAEFSNRFYKQTKNGMYMNFKANTTFASRVDSVTAPMFAADSGVTAVFKNSVNITASAGAKDMTCAGMKGTLVFEGTLVVAQLTESGDNVGGKIVLAGTGNNIAKISLNAIGYICSNENVMVNATVNLANRENGSYIDLNGFNQTVKQFSHGNTLAKYNHDSGKFISDTPATLTIAGTGVGTYSECNNRFDGKVSVVLDADPAYTNNFLHRSNTTTGDITVRSGVFDLNGERSHFANVPKISVESNGAFLLRTSAANALASVTNLTIASGGRFVIAAGSTSVPTTPFADGLVNLELASDSEFSLVENTSITANTLKVDGKPMHRGLYTSAKCPAIKSGTVVVLNGPPKGISVSFK